MTLTRAHTYHHHHHHHGHHHRSTGPYAKAVSGASVRTREAIVATAVRTPTADVLSVQIRWTHMGSGAQSDT